MTRRHGHPRDTAQVGGRREPCDVGDTATSERDDRSRPVEPELAPEAFEDPPTLCLFTRGKRVRRREAGAERLLDDPSPLVRGAAVWAVVMLQAWRGRWLV